MCLRLGEYKRYAQTKDDEKGNRRNMGRFQSDVKCSFAKLPNLMAEPQLLRHSIFFEL